MNISYREYSNSFIELTIETSDANITTDLTDLSGKVDPELIQQFRDIADSLEEWNEKKNLTSPK